MSAGVDGLVEAGVMMDVDPWMWMLVSFCFLVLFFAVIVFSFLFLAGVEL